MYELYHRIVDVEGFVSVDTNRYSVPLDIPVGRQLEVRKTKERIDIYEGPRVVATHPRLIESIGKRVTNVAHRPRRERRQPKGFREMSFLRDLSKSLENRLP